MCADSDARQPVIDVRICESMPYIVSILAVANQSQYIFQYLQSWDATLSTGPCGPAKILSFRCPKGQILEKIARCARKSAILTVKNRDSALDNGKNEDPAKMTYSIPDFVSRNTINTPIYIPILAVLAVNTTIPILAVSQFNLL